MEFCTKESTGCSTERHEKTISTPLKFASVESKALGFENAQLASSLIL